MKNLQNLANTFLKLFESNKLDITPGTQLDSLSIEEAYRVQQMVIDARINKGEEIIGYKIGCTSKAIRQQFGLSEPICGYLMSPHIYHGNTELIWKNYTHCAVEPELVLKISKDIKHEVHDTAILTDAIEFVSPGIEVHNYNFWFGKPSIQELIASNGIHACLVVGENKVKPDSFDWNMEGVGIFVNDDLAASGICAETLGSPLKSLQWLVNHLLQRGEYLKAGQLVIPGSAVKLVPAELNDIITSRFTNVGNVEIRFI